MDNVWKKIMEVIALAIKKPDIPPVVKGAGALIRRLCEEEAKIAETEYKNTKGNMTIPHESIATIVYKYGNRDIYKDVYQFIKA